MPEPHAPSTTASFPVVLHDGGRQSPLRNINLHPDLTFKQFQMKLSHITGISYNNLTTYLVDNNTPPPSPEFFRRRILITSKVNFAVIVKQTNCYFFVVLKRSRRDRRRNHSFAGKHDDACDEYNKFCYGYDVTRCCYMNVIVKAAYGSGFDLPFSVNFPKIEDVYGDRVKVKECTAAMKENRTPEFHHCVYDEVVVGWFRSPAGPICRRRS